MALRNTIHAEKRLCLKAHFNLDVVSSILEYISSYPYHSYLEIDKFGPNTKDSASNFEQEASPGANHVTSHCDIEKFRPEAMD